MNYDEKKADCAPDEIDGQLLPVFLGEAEELCPRIGSCLRALRRRGDDEQALQLLGRLLHTLKGGARMTGLMQMGRMIHAMEERLTGQGVWEELEAEMDSLSLMFDQLRESLAEPNEVPGVMLRVRSNVVDDLLGRVSQMDEARLRMEEELHAYREEMQGLSGNIAQLRTYLFEAEGQIDARTQSLAAEDEQDKAFFGRLQELARFMRECVYGVQSAQKSLLHNLDEAALSVFAQAQLSGQMQQALRDVRRVHFGSLSERLHRLVRQTARQANKRAVLELNGSDVELDRHVLEQMTAPIEHLLRNAIAHGLEDEGSRLGSGKDATGEIRLEVRRESDGVVFEFSDDGRGLDYAALRREALKKGLLDEADDETLARMIFLPGISTVAEVTELAGRGIGLDVVLSEILALGGRIDVFSRSGQGTRFTIFLPQEAGFN